jgi:hypothetical protein
MAALRRHSLGQTNKTLRASSPSIEEEEMSIRLPDCHQRSDHRRRVQNSRVEESVEREGPACCREQKDRTIPPVEVLPVLGFSSPLVVASVLHRLSTLSAAGPLILGLRQDGQYCCSSDELNCIKSHPSHVTSGRIECCRRRSAYFVAHRVMADPSRVVLLRVPHGKYAPVAGSF